MKYFIFLALFSFTSVNLFGVDIHARVIMKNGEEIIYKMKKLPKKESKKVDFFDSNNKKIVMESDSIKYLIVSKEGFENSKSYIMSYTDFVEYNYRSGEPKITKKKGWIVAWDKTNTMELYAISDEYSILKDGNFRAKSVGSGGFKGDIWYLIQRNNEERPTVIGLDLGSIGNANAYFKKFGSLYFSDCPDLVEQIKENKIKGNNIKTAMLYYEENCK